MVRATKADGSFNLKDVDRSTLLLNLKNLADISANNLASAIMKALNATKEEPDIHPALDYELGRLQILTNWHEAKALPQLPQ